MRQVSIRTLRVKLSTQLQDLPVEITRNGKIIAVLCTQEDYYDEVEIKPRKSSNRNHNTKTTSPTGGRSDKKSTDKYGTSRLYDLEGEEEML